jgi:hypothetical protein
MALTYVVRAEVNMNGSAITDFKAFEETTRVVSKAVPLMHSTGNAQLTRRFAFTLDYVVPSVNEIDWETYVGTGGTGTASLVYDSGTQIDFGQVSLIEVGAATVDGENELVRKLQFMAGTRNGDHE